VVVVVVIMAAAVMVVLLTLRLLIVRALLLIVLRLLLLPPPIIPIRLIARVALRIALLLLIHAHHVANNNIIPSIPKPTSRTATHPIIP
jgi:hypothetical protein